MNNIKDIDRADGKARVIFMRHANDLFSFEEESELEASVPGIGPYTYWTTTFTSGLYDDLAVAERDAKAQIPWLRGLVP